MWRLCLLAAAMVCSMLNVTRAADGPAFTDPEKAGPDFKIQGEYEGMIKTPEQEMKVGAQVIALGDGKFQGVFLIGGLPGDGWRKGDVEIKAYNKKVDDGVLFEGEAGTAKIVDGKMTIHDSTGAEIGSLEKIDRKSPTLGAEPPGGATVLFGGKTGDLVHWQGGKIVEDDLLLAGTTGTDNLQDFTLHLEFRTPFVPTGRGQGRGNSGLYLQDRYECQILDSFGLEGLDNECGGFYQIKAPDVNMCYPPLSWQTYDIDFTAARFDGDKKVKNAQVTVKHNGVVIHDEFELPNLTPGGAATEAPGKGPLKLQAHGNPVTYRNIWVVEK